MPKDVQPGSKDIKGNLDQHTYPSSVDNMMRNDRDFEGSENALPPSSTNPIMGADGKLGSQKISKVK